MIELNKIYNEDCLEGMKRIPDGSVDCIVTDIPYNECNRTDNGLRNLDKDKADIGCFDITELTDMLCNKTRGSIYMFCGFNQVSNIRMAMTAKGLSTRIIVWENTNPSPMNGDYIYLSATENAVWFKKKGATFNAHCKSNVFQYPCGRSKLHPTEKNHDLIKELILDNSNEGDIVFDPCCGSGCHCMVAKENNRRFIGCELDDKYFEVAKSRFC